MIREISNGKSNIKYSEFLSATMDPPTHEKVMAVFKSLSKNGKISESNIRTIFSKFNREVSDEEIEMLKIHEITFHEF